LLKETTERRYKMVAKRKRTLTKSIVSNALYKFFWYSLLIGLAFIIMYPFLVKLSSMFMSMADTYDDTVALIPRNPTFENIKYVFKNTPLPTAYLNTLFNSLLCAVLSTATSITVGYGLAKFNFIGKKILMAVVLLSLLIPFSTIMIPTYMHFRYFDIFGIVNLITGSSISTVNSPFPLWFLALTGFGFRCGLYILIIRQAFCGLPKELDEAGMVDGANAFQLFLNINVPLVRSMAFVVFILSFAWQWTDSLYNNLLLPTYEHFPRVLTLIASKPETALGSGTYAISILSNTALLLIIIPLLFVFVLSQRQLVQGIERAGLVG
jgi:multiple sugar transport system permease protein